MEIFRFACHYDKTNSTHFDYTNETYGIIISVNNKIYSYNNINDLKI